MVRRRRSKSAANGAYFAGLEVTSVIMDALRSRAGGSFIVPAMMRGKVLRADFFADQHRCLLRDGFRPGLIRIEKQHFRTLMRQPPIKLPVRAHEKPAWRSSHPAGGPHHFCGQCATGRFRSPLPARA